MKTEELEKKIAKAERKIEKWKRELKQHNKPLNGWCVPDVEPDSEKVIVFFKDGEQIHGIGFLGDPFKGETGIHKDKFRKATPEEIQERLFDSELHRSCHQMLYPYIR